MKRVFNFFVLVILLSLTFSSLRITPTRAALDSSGDANQGADIFRSQIFDIVTPGAAGGDGPGGVGTTDGSSSLELWLRPDRGVYTNAACTTAAADSNAVYCWADQSGNNMNVIQATSNNRPLFYITTSANLINGQPTLRFDGINDFFNVPASVIQGRTAFSFFTAFRQNSLSNWQRLWDFGTGTNNNAFVTVRSSNGTTPRFAIKAAPNTTEQQLSFSSGLTTGSGQIMNVIWNTSGGTGWRNGGSQATRSTSSWVPSNLGTISLHYIGKSIYTADPYLNANIGEFIVYSSALNNTERILVENYLSAKYNVALTANDVYDGDADDANHNFDFDMAGIGRFGGVSHTQAHSAGMIVVNNTFLQDNGDWLTFGHRTAVSGRTGFDLPTTGDWALVPNPQRWTRHWYFDRTDAGTAGGTVDIIFDFSEGNMNKNGESPTGSASNYRLLGRADGVTQFSEIATASVIIGDQVQFLGVDVTLLGSNFTLGTLDDGTSPTAISLQSFSASASTPFLFGTMFLTLLLVFGSVLIWQRRKAA